jgi:hypothetical protein
VLIAEDCGESVGRAFGSDRFDGKRFIGVRKTTDFDGVDVHELVHVASS